VGVQSAMYGSKSIACEENKEEEVEHDEIYGE
jgi:hypothetical protein